MRLNMRLLIITVMVFLLFSLSGCTRAYYREMIRASMEHTQCKPDELVIEDDSGSVTGGFHSWKVECPGKKYKCVEASMGNVDCQPIPY